MVLATAAIAVGLLLLVWSANRFVEGSASTASHFGMPPLLIGMVVVGFGTSAPEMVVSALAASQGNPGIALGNAYGSNITNIALILGVTALISPIAVHSQVLRKELPLLTLVTALAAWQLWDGQITRLDAVVLLAVFGGLMGWTIWQGLQAKEDALGTEIAQELDVRVMPIRRAVFWLVAGLLLLILSSRILVWGAVEIAQGFGVSDLIIGLTIVAVGTSLPELVTTIIAAWRKQAEVAFGNVIGSNIYNILGIGGATMLFAPGAIPNELISRDLPVMVASAILLLLICFFFRRFGRMTGLLLVAGYSIYLGILVAAAI